jgi:uncharacterized protein YbaR (Trm112 family)
MRRAFDVEVLACPRCGGHLRLIATVEEPHEIREILAGLALAAERVDRAPPPRASVEATRWWSVRRAPGRRGASAKRGLALRQLLTIQLSA